MTQRRRRNERRYARAYQQGYEVGRRHCWFWGFGTGVVFGMAVLAWTLFFSSPLTNQATVTFTFASPGHEEASTLSESSVSSIQQLLANGWL